jgi:hypothetical protein
MKASTISKVLEAIRVKLINCHRSKTLRNAKSPKAFTRNGGKLGAFNTVFLILRGMKNSLQSVLDEFFRDLCKGEIMATKQAISKARQQVNPQFVREFFDENVSIVLLDDSLETFKGKHVIGIDGCDIALENEEALIDEFGCSGSKKDACTALSSFACDVYSGVAYDCRIAPYAESERSLMNQHILRLCELKLQGSILMGDRGYPSYEEFMHIIDCGFYFLIRLPRSFSNVISQIENGDTKFVICDENGCKYYFRAIAVTLSTGEIEYLATSLPADFLSPLEAKALYRLRWGNETKYDHLKNTLEIENFSGKTVASVDQDVYATVTLANVISIVAAVADVIIAQKDALNSNLKHYRKANRNTVARNMVLSFLTLMVEPNLKKRQREMDRLFARIVRNPVPIVPDRNPPRKSPRKKKYHCAKRK